MMKTKPRFRLDLISVQKTVGLLNGLKSCPFSVVPMQDNTITAEL